MRFADVTFCFVAAVVNGSVCHAPPKFPFCQLSFDQWSLKFLASPTKPTMYKDCFHSRVNAH
ncbi:hypothetical protein Fmac_012826 [Flemingia macrophylla]|uniref:Secreted protein n=1 Tax=Flemingia macrophylla TaxID=520843 RepID=A0ABD1MRE2_9FABA